MPYNYFDNQNSYRAFFPERYMDEQTRIRYWKQDSGASPDSGRNGRRSLGLLLLGEEADGTGSRTGRHWNPFTQSSQMPASLLSSLAFELQ